MIGAATDEIIARHAGHADMAHFAVADATRRRAMDNQADADAGADRHIGEVGQAFPTAPQHLRHGRTIHVGVEGDGHAKGRRQRPRNVGIRPTGLGRGQDMTIGRGLRMNVDRPEGCKTKSRKPPLRLPLSQDRQDRRQCFVRCGRGNGLLVQNGARRRRQRTDALGATQFDTSKRAAVRMIS